MSNGANSDSHWGILINPDKSPAPLLEQLCLDDDFPYLKPSFCAGGSTDLTPERLAAFYRKVGGNYDALFLETKSQALSFIYQSLGCFHSLQPSTNPYERPSTPSLLPNGFVRWQTIQLLMDPDEHSRYLQNAVSLWNLTDANGEPLPKEIPRGAFPPEPDPEMLQWHEGVSKRLEYDFVRRNTPHPCSPKFGAYYGHGSSKDHEDDYFSHMPPGSGRRRSHFDSPGSRRRARKPHHAFTSSPNEPRSGFASPQVPTPPPRPERPRRTRDHTAWMGRSVSPSTSDADDASAESSNDAVGRAGESLQKKHRDKRNLSPPAASRARRHSHDAYTRKPVRDLSPAAPRRPRRSHGSRSSKPQTSEERPRSKPSGVKFREYIFDDPAAPPAPVSAYPQGLAPSPPPPPAPPPPRYVPRHRNLDPYDETRRQSYSGGSGSSSRPGSGGGSSSERPRSYSNAGLPSRLSPRTSSARSSAANRYIPASVAEDDDYMGSRRVPAYN